MDHRCLKWILKEDPTCVYSEAYTLDLLLGGGLDHLEMVFARLLRRAASVPMAARVAAGSVAVGSILVAAGSRTIEAEAEGNAASPVTPVTPVTPITRFYRRQHTKSDPFANGYNGDLDMQPDPGYNTISPVTEASTNASAINRASWEEPPKKRVAVVRREPATHILMPSRALALIQTPWV
jgi:hypothetical protein